MHCLKLLFWLAVTAISVLRGYYAVTILVTGGKKLTFFSERNLPIEERHHWSWWAHEIFINFAGSMIGWAVAYYLIFCHPKIETIADGFLVLVAITGVFGFLPWIIFKTGLKKGD